MCALIVVLLAKLPRMDQLMPDRLDEIVTGWSAIVIHTNARLHWRSPPRVTISLAALSGITS